MPALVAEQYSDFTRLRMAGSQSFISWLKYRRHGDQDVDQEARNAQNKPLLSAEGFQRLLAAAYILQTNAARRPSPIGASGTNSFAGAGGEKNSFCDRSRTPAAVPPEYLVAQYGIMADGRSPRNSSIFCMMVGASIHRLSTLPAVRHLPRLSPNKKTRPSPRGRRKVSWHWLSRSWRERHCLGLMATRETSFRRCCHPAPKTAVNFLAQAPRKTTSSPVQRQFLTPKSTASEDGALDQPSAEAQTSPLPSTVVEYGADVKMWLGSPKKSRALIILRIDFPAELDRPARHPRCQSDPEPRGGNTRFPENSLLTSSLHRSARSRDGTARLLQETSDASNP